MNIELFQDGTAEKGFSFHYFLAAFNDTFYKSGHELFKNFFIKNRNIKKWMVFADYAFYDKKKNNDIVTFTFAPYPYNFDKISNQIEKLSFKDIKNLKKVNPEFLEFIKKSEILNISFFLDRKRRLSYDNERELFIHSFELAIKLLEEWCVTTPQNEEYYREFISKISFLIHELRNNQGVNMKAIRDIEIISNLAAYLMFEATNVIDIEKIGWFSDRDTLLSYKATKFKTPIIHDFVSVIYYLLCTSHDIEDNEKLALAIPEENGKCWYDSFNRIPDFISATLSDYNLKNNSLTHDKFRSIMEELLASNEKNLFFKINFSEKVFSASRILIEGINRNSNKPR